MHQNQKLTKTTELMGTKKNVPFLTLPIESGELVKSVC